MKISIVNYRGDTLGAIKSSDKDKFIDEFKRIQPDEYVDKIKFIETELMLDPMWWASVISVKVVARYCKDMKEIKIDY